MSQTTISAPSAARASACERPWPRAPPVIRATRPSSFPIAVVSVRRVARSLRVVRSPADRGDAVGLGEDGRDPVADRRPVAGILGVVEPADQVRPVVQLDHRDRVGDLVLELGRERPVVDDEGPDRPRRPHLVPGRIPAMALRAADQRGPAQLAAGPAALDDQPALAGGVPERGGERVGDRGEGCLLLGAGCFPGHAPTPWSVERIVAAAFTKPWLEQYRATCGSSTRRAGPPARRCRTAPTTGP